MRATDQHQRESSEAEADDNGGQHKRLRQWVRRIGGKRARALVHQRRNHGSDPAGREDAEVCRGAEQDEAEQGARQVAGEQEIGGRGDQHADGSGEKDFHRRYSSATNAKAIAVIVPMTTR